MSFQLATAMSSRTFLQLQVEKSQTSAASCSDLKVVVAGEGNEEVEEETLAVLVDLWSVVVQS